MGCETCALVLCTSSRQSPSLVGQHAKALMCHPEVASRRHAELAMLNHGNGQRCWAGATVNLPREVMSARDLSHEDPPRGVLG